LIDSSLAVPAATSALFVPRRLRRGYERFELVFAGKDVPADATLMLRLGVLPAQPDRPTPARLAQAGLPALALSPWLSPTDAATTLLGRLALWLAPPLVVAAVAFWAFTAGGEDAKVEFRVDGTAVATVSLGQALQRAEAEVGYDLVRPRKLPGGYRPEYVDALWVDDEVRHTREQRVMIGYADTSGGETPLTIVQGADPVGPTVRLVRSTPAPTAWKSIRAGGTAGRTTGRSTEAARRTFRSRSGGPIHRHRRKWRGSSVRSTGSNGHPRSFASGARVSSWFLTGIAIRQTAYRRCSVRVPGSAGAGVLRWPSGRP